MRVPTGPGCVEQGLGPGAESDGGRLGGGPGASMRARQALAKTPLRARRGTVDDSLSGLSNPNNGYCPLTSDSKAQGVHES